MKVYIDTDNVDSFLNNQKDSIKNMKNSIDIAWPHYAIINKLLNQSLEELNGLNIITDSNKTMKHERKIEKYLDWVEVYRLANYHFGRYFGKKESLSEGLFSTLVSLNNAYINNQNIEKVGVIGCGPGRSVLDFSYCYPKATIYGLDYSSVALTLGKKIVSSNTITEIIKRDYEYNDSGVEINKIKGFNRKNCKWGLFDLTKSNLKNKFDIVVCSNVLNLMPDHIEALKKVYNMTNYNGYIIYADLMGWRLDRKKEQTILSNKNNIQKSFEKIGFETIECFIGGPYVEQENNNNFSFYKECFYIGRKVD